MVTTRPYAVEIGRLPIDGSADVPSAIVTADAIIVECSGSPTGYVLCTTAKVDGTKATPSEVLSAVAAARVDKGMAKL